MHGESTRRTEGPRRSENPNFILTFDQEDACIDIVRTNPHPPNPERHGSDIQLKERVLAGSLRMIPFPQLSAKRAEMLPHDPATLTDCLRETLVYVPPEGLSLSAPPDDDTSTRHAEIVRRVLGFSGGAAFDILNQPCWSLLLERIGPAAMTQLLSSSSMFWPLPNGCLTQERASAPSRPAFPYRSRRLCPAIAAHRSAANTDQRQCCVPR